MSEIVSHALWPNKHESIQRHKTREEAEAANGLLKKLGFNYDGKVFPVATWVTPDAPRVGRPDFIDARGNGDHS